MKGYQRGDKPNQTNVRALADQERRPYSSQRNMHMEREEGGSVCVRCRSGCYNLTKDETLVTCKGCLKAMGKETKT